MEKKVFIGVGHGGKDPGAVANGFEEADLNLAIALACRAELVRHGVTVGMSRVKDENDELKDEIKECNAFKPALAVDIHNNAGGGDGAEAYYPCSGGVGKTLAVNILDEILKIGQNSRGAKTRKNSKGKDYYGFIRQTNAPAVIVECAFVDNKKDIQCIDTAAEQKAMGIAIAKGILKTLGIAWQAQTITLDLPVLCKGTKGAVVEAVQVLLTAATDHDLAPDGSYGGKTEDATEDYQRDNGLPVTGIIDKATWSSLLGV